MEFSQSEKKLISAIADNYPIAARVLLTGEVHKSYIGIPSTYLLLSANDMIAEPLFMHTNAGTVKMTRFDPINVWRCFHPQILIQLVEDESKRLGIDDVSLDYYCYYTSMLIAIKKRYGDRFIYPVINDSIRSEAGELEAFFLTNYLGSLLLFGKSGYDDVAMSRFFAMPLTAQFMQTVSFYTLNAEQQSELIDIRNKYGKISGISNTEFHFVSHLFDSI